MPRKLKPRAYLNKWNFQYENEKWTKWYAIDELGICIAKTNNRKECEKICRVNGYVPVMR